MTKRKRRTPEERYCLNLIAKGYPRKQAAVMAVAWANKQDRRRSELRRQRQAKTGGDYDLSGLPIVPGGLPERNRRRH